MRVPLDSEQWQSMIFEERSMPIASVLESWQKAPPSEDEFRQFVESMSCSDCMYDSFYFSLPYLLDQIDIVDEASKEDFIWHLRITMAAGQAGQSKECQQVFESCLPRLRAMLIERLEAMPSRSMLLVHIAGLAACYGEPRLAEEIARIELDFE